MKVEFDLDKTVYDYMRHRNMNLEQVVNDTLRHKFGLGKLPTKPQPYLPIEQSVELGIDYFNTDVNNPESLIELVNHIIRLYPYTNEEKVMTLIGRAIKRKHKYDRFTT